MDTGAHGALVRSRFQSISEMDVPSQFFFNLEKKNGQKNRIFNVYGLDPTRDSDIQKRAVSFYKELYACECGADQSTNLFLSQMTEDSCAGLVHFLTTDELFNALQSIKNGEAPDLDGLPVEFYKAYWHFQGEDLFAVLSRSLSEGRLPVLTLLPEKGDLKEVKNWRPVSLLCTDYKILSKTLTNRLREVLGQVRHINQYYCEPN